jgi:DNA-directed RNA polymerase specialized sigma24 family protein
MLAETVGGGRGGGRRSREHHVDVFADLVRRIQAGDRLALEPLLEQAGRTAYRFSVLVCGNAPDAVDTMQDALLKTCRYAASIRKPEHFREWLYRTVRNACVMRRRRRVHEPDRLLSIEQWGRTDGGTCRVLDSSCGPETGMVNS